MLSLPGLIHFPKQSNGNDQTVKPIPDINTDSKHRYTVYLIVGKEDKNLHYLVNSMHVYEEQKINTDIVIYHYI